MKEQAAGAVRPVVEWLQTQGLVLGSRVISALLILMVAGPANRSNVNDNSSGVAAVSTSPCAQPAVP